MLKASFDIGLAKGEFAGDISCLLEISERHLGLVFFLREQRKILCLKLFSLGLTEKINYLEELRNIISTELQVVDNFEDIQVIYNSIESSLIPLSGFSADLSEPLMDFSFGAAPRRTVLSEPIASEAIVNLYRLPEELYNSMRRLYPQARHQHIYSAMVPLYKKEAVHNAYIKVEFYTERYILLIYKDQQLLLANSYNYQTPEDVVYYMLALCEQLEISAKEVRIAAAGLIDGQSPLFAEINKFFAWVNFDAGPESADLSAVSSEYPSHYFANLIKLALCE